MKVIGLIAEYNPFHNGHKYQINKIKEMFKDSLIICVTSSSFCQRGDYSLLNKWDKTSICLDNGIDLVIELPFVFSSQSADIFAKGALQILSNLNIDYLVFGSESNNIEKLKYLANKALDTNYSTIVKEYLKKGYNYPTALAKALNEENNDIFNNPNDLLALSYLKEIYKNNYKIEPITIKRTNNYNDTSLNNNIASATAIRKGFYEGINITSFINYNSNILYKDNNYFKYLKYKIISDKNILNTYQTVDEGLENRIIKAINKANNTEELINLIKNKRHTYNRIKRMLTHILVSFTKEEAKNNNVSYIRILGFNKNGKTYLHNLKDTKIPIITNYKKIDSKILDIEYRITEIYSLIINDTKLIDRELKKPIIK